MLNHSRSSLMTSSSSSSLSRTWKYHVFANFFGPDVRKTFLSHLRKQFKWITMFNDEEIGRSQTIAPALVQAIRESRISIVIISKNYACTSWCLDELLEILKCKADLGQIVMTIFYGVDPSDVRKQTGYFGEDFHRTCCRTTEEVRLQWSHALTSVANIAGEVFERWENEANMIESIARNVSDVVNATSSLSRNVFTSFHGPDVRKTFLSHLRKQFNDNGIMMFDDQGIERSQTIAPALTQAIRASRISIVVLSKYYASSSWCLDELLEILKCKEDLGQIVMTVFYGAHPSEVRNQTGDFGRVFKQTCGGISKEKRQIWSKALKDVGNIAGEHSLNWDNESNMMEKIVRDVANKLSITISKNFEDMVGIEAHLQKMQSLLQLENDEAMIVGICGPAGIGKTTIARTLHRRISNSFQHTCFMENIKGSYNRDLDEYGLKLCLQDQLLSKILDQKGMRIYHLGAIQQRLCNQKVLIILDDVDDLKQLEALANKTNWFGPGSRIIITTEDQELLEQHNINNTYHVDFPTKEEEALEKHDIKNTHHVNFPTTEEERKILCSCRWRSTRDSFEKLAKRVTKLCSKLMLNLGNAKS